MWNVLLTYVLHVCGWFLLGAFSSVIFGRSNMLRFATAAALGFVSFVAVLIYQHLF